MTKKDLLVKLLEKITPYWDLADGLIALVGSQYVDEKTIDGILSIMNGSIKRMEAGVNKIKLQRAATYVERLKAKEHINEIQDQEEANKLMEDLQSFDS